MMQQVDVALGYHPDGAGTAPMSFYSALIDQEHRAVRLSPDDPEAHFNLAMAYLEGGQEPLARAQLERLRGGDSGLARDLEAHLKP